MVRAWTAAGIPDLHGATAVVTGANGGIGLEVARGLASKGAGVVLAVRSRDRGEAAAEAIRTTCAAASLEVLVLDLADLASVRRFAAALGSRVSTLDLLINNAGLESRTLQHTADGFELVFGTNHLGHFALTGRLLPLLLAARSARVITVTSLAHKMGRIEFDNLDAAKGYSDARAYAQSKLANVLFAYELQRRLSAAGSDVLSVACHPGWAATQMTVGTPGEQVRLVDRLMHTLARRLAPSTEHGAPPILFAATSPDLHAGDYLGPSGWFGVWGGPGRGRSSSRSRDEAVAWRLWQASESMTGTQYAFAAAVPNLAAAG